MVHKDRIRQRNTHSFQKGSIVYFMNRDQRIHDNWAFLYAQQIAFERKERLVIVHNLKKSFLGGIAHQFHFKVAGLQETADDAQKYNVPFFLFFGDDAEEKMIEFFHREKVGAIVTDFSPLRIQQEWVSELIEKITVPFFEVDAHNIIPAWIVSQKQEFAARTIRPKIHRLLPEFLEPFPPCRVHSQNKGIAFPIIDWEKIKKSSFAESVQVNTDWIKPGHAAAKKMLQRFITERLPHYHTMRNDPLAHVVSDLSPYLHYGHISAQRVALEVRSARVAAEARDVFLEELIVRKELADNFCFYNPQYDSFEGFPDWAKKTLEAHMNDPREYCYSQEDFEQARTHDDLWNATQQQLLQTGKMHGYMRMYWAKKILEWTNTPQEALEIAILLNDRYQLDGRDPNGYTGIAWSIGGVHDRPWFNRPIFGLVRYMNKNGMKKKVAVDDYIARYIPQSETQRLKI